MKTNIKNIVKYIAAVICLLLLLTVAAVPIVQLTATGDNFEAERVLFEEAVQDDFKDFLPELKMDINITRHVTSGWTYISIYVSQREKTKDRENLTGYTNVEIIAHIWNFCLRYFDNHKGSDLYKAFSNNNPDSNFHIGVGMYDKQYRSWENLDGLTFDNDYRSYVHATPDDETGLLFDRLGYTNIPVRMSDLMNFTDLSLIDIKDIVVDSYDEYDFSAFKNLKYIYISDLKESDTEKIDAIKRTLPEGCKLWISDTSTSLKEVK